MHALRLGESLRIETISLEGEERKGLLKKEPFYSPFGPNFPLVIHIFQIFLRNVRIGVRSTRVELLQLARNCDHSTLVVDNAICVTYQPTPSRAKYSLTRASFRFPPHDESLGSRLARNTVVLPQIREGKSIRRFRAFAPPPLSSRVSFITPVSPRVHTRDTLERERVVDLLLLLIVEGLIDPF